MKGVELVFNKGVKNLEDNAEARKIITSVEKGGESDNPPQIAVHLLSLWV